MSTLVIHPADKSTDFLKVIYKDLDCTVINNPKVGRSELKTKIKSHDRVIMLGHGSSAGLYRPDFSGYIIDSDLVYLLKEKENNVYIWCNADIFVKKYDLKGFYTGMIVSDMDEAYSFVFFLRPPTVKDVDISNELFAEAVKKGIELPAQEMEKVVKDNYHSEENDIIMFNEKNIYSSQLITTI